MPYGPIVSREMTAPEYRFGASVLDSNGEYGLTVSISAIVNDATFPEEADSAFQALVDLLDGSPIFAVVGGGEKSWTASRTVTPTP